MSGVPAGRYCASKWAVEGLSKAMARELAPHKIRVNTIAPTFIETAMTAPFFHDEPLKSQVLSKIKLARAGPVGYLPGALLYIPSACSNLETGSWIVIDGGCNADYRESAHKHDQ